MKPATAFTTTETANLSVGFCTIQNEKALRLLQFAETIGSKDYWWCETLFMPSSEAIMVAFRHGSSYRPLHAQCR